MQRMKRIVLVLLFVVGSCSIVNAESGSRWWPFSGDNDTAQPAATSPPLQRSMNQQRQSPTATPPRIAQRGPVHEPPTSTDPKSSWLPRPKFWAAEPKSDFPNNTWYAEPPKPPAPSPWESVKGGVRRVGEGTRAAWDRTVDLLTPGESKTRTNIARNQPKPPLWKRMMGIEEQKPQGPRTVTEWMAQDRLDP